MKVGPQILILAAISSVFVVGIFIGRWTAPLQKAESKNEEVWYCPMHTQVNEPEAGPCPICGMDLVKKGAATSEYRMEMSDAQRKLAEIQTAAVERRFVSKEIRLVGKVTFDETRMGDISARVPGRLDRLFVDYTGIRVRAGDHLVSLYSPELRTAQTELLQAKQRLTDTSGEKSEFLVASSKRAYTTARDKLILWGLTEAQVDEIETRGSADDHIMITSPTTGVVISKELSEGEYVETGTSIYKIADMDHLWIMLEAYEQDLQWIRYGQAVSVEAEAYPGRAFTGLVAFIDPVLDDRTRTVRVRVNIDNLDQVLKPGMFVHADLSSNVGLAGSTMEPRLSGKWICPMHPEIVKDAASDCDICGMDLVATEDFGFVGPQDPGRAPLVVPESAVLITGRRALVYVEMPGAERPTYEGREVVLGPRADGMYVLLSGVEEGEQVVTNGAFRIDSSMQLFGKASMMSQLAAAETWLGDETETFRASLAGIYQGYLGTQSALAADDYASAAERMLASRDGLALVQPDQLSAPAAERWLELRAGLLQSFEMAAEAQDIAALRVAFADFAAVMLRLDESFRHPGDQTHREVFCSMAFDDGAAWLQIGDEIRNPFYGSEMLNCGELRGTYPGLGELAGKGR